MLSLVCHFRMNRINEANFWLNGYVNKKNSRIWSDYNPQPIVETPLNTQKVTVWCALWAEGIIGPYFFKNEAGHNVTVNGACYRGTINDFFVPEFEDVDVDDLWFQQDGATCHTPNETINLFKETFGERIISRRGLVAWPPRSCDLNPLDYFVWVYVKSLFYADKSDFLKHNDKSLSI